MNLRDQLLDELKQIIGQQQQQLDVSEGPRTVRVAVEQCEALAVGVSQFLLETPELAGIDLATLESASKSLCQRVNYLLEPISPIETDADGCMVQMRSSPPQVGESGRYYYELLLRRGGSVELCRYEKTTSAPRTRVAATLTHEVLGRLVEDFDATVEEIMKP